MANIQTYYLPLPGHGAKSFDAIFSKTARASSTKLSGNLEVIDLYDIQRKNWGVIMLVWEI